MNIIISKNIRIRYPGIFTIGNNSIIDDFCYFSTGLIIGEFCHIAPLCSSIGGKKYNLILKGFNGIGAGTRIICSSDDFVNDIVFPVDVSTKVRINGDIVFEKYAAIGTNSVVMPNNTLLEGTVIGALSFAPAAFKFEPWTVYAGIPIKKIKIRNRDSVLEQVKNI